MVNKNAKALFVQLIVNRKVAIVCTVATFDY